MYSMDKNGQYEVTPNNGLEKFHNMNRSTFNGSTYVGARTSSAYLTPVQMTSIAEPKVANIINKQQTGKKIFENTNGRSYMQQNNYNNSTPSELNNSTPAVYKNRKIGKLRKRKLTDEELCDGINHDIYNQDNWVSVMQKLNDPLIGFKAFESILFHRINNDIADVQEKSKLDKLKNSNRFWYLHFQKLNTKLLQIKKDILSDMYDVLSVHCDKSNFGFSTDIHNLDTKDNTKVKEIIDLISDSDDEPNQESSLSLSKNIISKSVQSKNDEQSVKVERKKKTEKECINLCDSEEEFLDIEEISLNNYSVNTQKLCNQNNNSLNNSVITTTMIQKLAKERNQFFNFLMSRNYPFQHGNSLPDFTDDITDNIDSNNSNREKINSVGLASILGGHPILPKVISGDTNEISNLLLPQPKLELNIEYENDNPNTLPRIVLVWNVDGCCKSIISYQVFLFEMYGHVPLHKSWTFLKEVQALKLPMAMILKLADVKKRIYYFTVRTRDVLGRFGPFSTPVCKNEL